MAILAPTPLAGFDFNEKEDYRAYDTRTSAILQKLEDDFEKQPTDCVKGAVVKFPYADGHAMYLVLEESPLTLQHIPFGDAWSIPAAHIRGLELDDITAMVASQKALKAMFLRR